MKSLFITIPVAPNGDVHHRITTWLLGACKWCLENGWHFRYEPVYGQPVCSTRNQQVHAFLKSDADVCFFLDSDAVPDMEGFLKLLDAIQRDDVDVVGGWSLMTGGKDPGVPVVLGPAAQDARGCPLSLEMAHSGEVQEITGGGLGAHCLMAKRHVLEEFLKRKTMWFEDKFYSDPDADGEKFGTRSWGHDILFCRRAAEYGFRIWLDASVFWGHVKPMDLRDWYWMSQLYRDEIASHIPMIDLLRRHWGNESYSAGPVFLLRMAFELNRLAEESACVECGSGLTTEVIASMLPNERFVTLEQAPEWADDTRRRSSCLNGRLIHAPLVDHGSYQWYAPGPDPEDPWRLKGRKVGLVICDGPRGDTKGGRIGVVEQLGPWLADDFLVLLDDVHREAEVGVMEAWQAAYPDIKTQIVQDGNKAFAALLHPKKEAT